MTTFLCFSSEKSVAGRNDPTSHKNKGTINLNPLLSLPVKVGLLPVTTQVEVNINNAKRNKTTLSRPQINLMQKPSSREDHSINYGAYLSKAKNIPQ